MEKSKAREQINRIQKLKQQLEAQRKLFVVAGMLEDMGNELWSAGYDDAADAVARMRELAELAVRNLTATVDA